MPSLANRLLYQLMPKPFSLEVPYSSWVPTALELERALVQVLGQPPGQVMESGQPSQVAEPASELELEQVKDLELELVMVLVMVLGQAQVVGWVPVQP
jgi:hypothetical protein